MKRSMIIAFTALICIVLLSPITLVFPPAAPEQGSSISHIIPHIGMNDSEARPGGGSSFRSSSSGRSSSSYSSGSSSGGDGEFIFFLFRVLFELLIHSDHPIMVLIIIIIIIAVIYYYNHDNSKNARTLIQSAPTQNNLAQKNFQLEQQLNKLRQHDTAFSRVLFLDFVHSLYHKYYSYRGTDKLQHLTPYFEAAILKEAEKPHYKKQKITEIVVGSLTISDYNESTDKEAIKVTLEANYTNTQDNKSHRHIVRESWLFTRQKGIHSLPPAKMRSISCPNCGAPAHFNDAGKCDYCHEVIHAGEHQWMLERRIILSDEQFVAQLLGTYVEEEGTELPVIRQEQLITRQAEFAQAHHAADWEVFWRDFQAHIVNEFFIAIYKAWTAQNWQTVRHLMTDRIYETNHFWIQQYQEQKFVNFLDKIEIQRVALAKIERDMYYEAITVRIYASCYDYVADSKGKVVGGSKRKARKFSEYWTFIRRTGVIQQENTFDLHSCPSCGAPLDKMSMAAECGYCGSKVSNGDFSWVLAIITQDEVYQG